MAMETDIQNLQQVPRPAQRGLHPPLTPPADTATGDLAVEPDVVAQAALALADQRPSLGVPLSTPSVDKAEGRAAEVVDPNVHQATATLLGPYASAPTVISASGVKPEDLSALHAKSQEATSLYALCSESEVDVEDSQRAVAAAQRLLRPQMRGAASRLLPTLSADAQAQLKGLLTAIDREESRPPAAAAARAKQTSSDDGKKAAALAEQRKREDVMRTFVTLRRGGSASPDDINAAYEALAEPDDATASDRRGNNR